jgi:hypothetical protein
MNKITLIKELRDGYSNQTKASNKYWSLLIIVSIISILNHNNEKDSIELPFGLGHVKQIDFHLTLLLMICTISIAFASAWIQQLRTRKLIQKVTDNISDKKKFIHKVHIQDYFDSTSSQTFNRIAPIAQILQGKNQFYDEKKPNTKNRLLGVVVYVFLKIVALVIVFLIPILALYMGAINFSTIRTANSLGLSINFYWFMIFISSGVFSIMIVEDI